MSENKSLWFYLKEIFRTRRAIKAYERLPKEDLEFKLLVTNLEYLDHHSLDDESLSLYRRDVEDSLKKVLLPANKRLASHRQKLLRHMGYPVTIAGEPDVEWMGVTVMVEVQGQPIFSRA